MAMLGKGVAAWDAAFKITDIKMRNRTRNLPEKHLWMKLYMKISSHWIEKIPEMWNQLLQS
jgi:hypothetical protein